MYSFIDSALSIVNRSRIFKTFSLALALLSPLTILLSIFHVDEEALSPTTMSAIILYFSTALARAFHMVSDCATMCFPDSLSNSLRELSPVLIIGRLWISAFSDWDDKAHV